jgi:hypothetical protein
MESITVTDTVSPLTCCSFSFPFPGSAPSTHMGVRMLLGLTPDPLPLNPHSYTLKIPTFIAPALTLPNFRVYVTWLHRLFNKASQTR